MLRYKVCHVDAVNYMSQASEVETFYVLNMRFLFLSKAKNTDSNADACPEGRCFHVARAVIKSVQSYKAFLL